MDIILKYFFLSNKEIEKINFFVELIVEWNKKINLISRKDIKNIYEHHILHSLTLKKFIEFKDNSYVLDVGTGGGFPGIPLAIVYPNVNFVLLDSIKKKVNVLIDIVEKIDLKNVKIIHSNIKKHTEKYDYILERYVMNFKVFYNLTKKNAKSNTIFIAYKYGPVEKEVLEINKKMEIFELEKYFEEEYFKKKKILILYNQV